MERAPPQQADAGDQTHAGAERGSVLEPRQPDARIARSPAAASLQSFAGQILNSPRQLRAQQLSSNLAASPKMTAQRSRQEQLFGTAGHTESAAPKQLASPPSPVVQRELKIRGSDDQSNALLALLGRATGLEFSRDAETRIVSIAQQIDATPQSVTLRARLIKIIADNGKHAQIDVRPDDDVVVGAFGPWQKLDVPALQAFEDQAPGAGVSMAIHEIWENYSAQRAGAEGGLGDYEPAHNAAIVVESAVAAEVSGMPGGRVADSAAGGYVAFDFMNYFLVLNPDEREAMRVARRAVGAWQLDRYAAGAGAHGEADGALVTAAGAELRNNAMATARITGYRTAAEDAGLSLARANTVLTELKAAAGVDDEDPNNCYVIDGGVAAAASVAISIAAPEGDWAAAEQDDADGERDDDDAGADREPAGGGSAAAAPSS